MHALHRFLNILTTVWRSLNQPNQVQQLERCWTKNYKLEQERALLERCWTRAANIG